MRKSSVVIPMMMGPLVFWFMYTHGSASITVNLCLDRWVFNPWLYMWDAVL